MKVLILNGPARGTVVDVETRTYLTPEGRVKMFESPGNKGTLRYRVGTIEYNGHKFNVASAASNKTIEESFKNALEHEVITLWHVSEAAKAFNADGPM